MGKSTTAKFFAEEGIPLYDADAVVHQLYEGAATPLVEAAFFGTTIGDKVDRDKLAKKVLGNPAAIKKLEAIIHPLVRRAEARFLEETARKGAAVRQGARTIDVEVTVLHPPRTGGMTTRSRRHTPRRSTSGQL